MDVVSWDENRHPRNPKGEFTSHPGGGLTHELARATKAAEHAANVKVTASASSGQGLTIRQVDGATFHPSIAKARTGPRGAFLSLYEPHEYDRMRCYSAEGGKVGGALKDHGDGRVEIVSLFNNGGGPGAGLRMFRHLMDEGGNYAECYGDQLRALYEKAGFKVTDAYEFDDSLAAPDWNYKRDGRPNYYLLRRT